MKIVCKAWFCEIFVALKEGAKSFNDIRREMRISTTSLSRRLRDLEDLTLIKSVVVDEDGKKIKYKLTGKGKKILPSIEEFVKLSDKIEREIANV